VNSCEHLESLERDRKKQVVSVVELLISLLQKSKGTSHQFVAALSPRLNFIDNFISPINFSELRMYLDPEEHLISATDISSKFELLDNTMKFLPFKFSRNLQSHENFSSLFLSFNTRTTHSHQNRSGGFQPVRHVQCIGPKITLSRLW
jgi:hypothetical protein